MCHGLEVLSKREWEFTNNESTKYITDTIEHHHIEHLLNILFNHSAHHIWVLKHSHLVKSIFLIKETFISTAVVRLSLLDCGLWKVVAVTSDSGASDHGGAILSLWLHLVEEGVHIIYFIVGNSSFVWVSFRFKNCVSQVSVTDGSGFG